MTVNDGDLNKNYDGLNKDSVMKGYNGDRNFTVKEFVPITNDTYEPSKGIIATGNTITAD